MLKLTSRSFILLVALFYSHHLVEPLVLNLTESDEISSLTNEMDDRAIDNDTDIIDLSMYGETIFGQPDEDTGTLVARYTEEDFLENPEELGTYLEGDILIPLSHYNFTQRNGMIHQSYRWPGAVVPYEIKGNFTSRELTMIGYAFNEYHTKTCIRFRPRTTQSDYISIVNDNTGCWSSIGRLGGKQTVNLQTPSCLMKYGTPIHELMHAIGFLHEQNRHERDSYIRVAMENIKPSMMLNFEKSSPRVVHGFGVDYDYASVMHYSPTSFSINGKPTISALKTTKEAQLMGQRIGFSKGDVKKVNAMYRCK